MAKLIIVPPCLQQVFAFLVALTLFACKTTTPLPLRGTNQLAQPILLEALEARADTRDANGHLVCSDLLLRGTSVERLLDRNGKEFHLGIIEMSDNGRIADDVQREIVMTQLRRVAVGDQKEPDSKSPGVVIVTFVHGWHHRPKVCDSNLACFRRVLRALSEAGGASGRPVFGIFIGWRGDTLVNAKVLSFYSRQATAQRIGSDAVREILLDLDRLYRTLNDRIGTPGRPHPVTMVTAGHSFGGALVYSAIEGALVRQLRSERFGSVLTVGRHAVDCGGTKVRPIRPGIGDLVVLVNPAFEARRYQIFADDENTPGRYADGQLPVLLTVASEGDDAVKIAFPISRILYFLAFPWRYLGWRDIIGAGHYDPHTTHDLVMTDDASNLIHPGFVKPHVPLADPDTIERCQLAVSGEPATCACEYEVPDFRAQPGADIAASRGDLTLSSGSVKAASNEHVALRPRRPRDPNSPYIVARASPAIISHHNDIYTPRFITFLMAYIGKFLERSAQVRLDSTEGNPTPCTPPAIVTAH